MVYYSYYNDIFGGKILTPDNFNKYADLALRYIKTVIDPKAEYTIGMLEDAVCAIAELIYEKFDDIGVKSESIDGVNVTYTDGIADKSAADLLRLYIPQELLYRGM